MNVYIYQHIPFLLRLRLNSQPPIMAGTQISYTPPVRTTKAHTNTSLSVSPYSPLVLYGLQICLCVHLGGKGGRRWRISDRMDTLVKENLRYRWTMHMNLTRDYILQS